MELKNNKPTMTFRRHNTSPASSSSSSAGRSVIAPMSVGRRITTCTTTASRRKSTVNNYSRRINVMKSNPYVGWFLHSPPTTTISSTPRLSTTAMMNLDTVSSKNNYKHYYHGYSSPASATVASVVPVSLSACKNSPHIGWFRHAPPSRVDLIPSTTSTTIETSSSCKSLIEEEEEMLIKLLQELNPALDQVQIRKDIRTLYLSQQKKNKQYHHRHHMIVTGHLRGGGKEYLEGTRRKEQRRFVKDLQESSAEGTLSTVNALSRLASWFLFPLAHDAESCGYRHDNDITNITNKKNKKTKNRMKRGDVDTTHQNEGIFSHLSPYLPTFLEEPSLDVSRHEYSKYGGGARIVTDFDNYDYEIESRDDNGDDSDDSDCDSEVSSIASPPMPSSLNYSGTGRSNSSVNNDLSLSVSSLAEAYYAHQTATKDMGSALLSEPPATPPSHHHHHPSSAAASASLDVNNVSPHRLDYVITQMDIARMTRNASRHLDVQSILSLPVITFRKGIVPNTKSPCSRKKYSRNNSRVSATTATATNCKIDQQQQPGWSWTIVEESDGRRDSEADYVPSSSAKKEEIEFCVICLEHFVDGDRLRVLPCDHSFHVGCIDRWLSGSQSFEECYTSGCPTCKKRPTDLGSKPRSQSLGNQPSSNRRNDKHRSGSLDGSVPSWAFARLGSALMTQQEQEQGESICSGSSSS